MSESLPHDRSHVDSEKRNAASQHLHDMSSREIAELINREDQCIANALHDAMERVVAFIDEVETGFLRGGRLVYIGAGTSGRLGVLDASEAPPTFQVPPDRIIGIIAGGDKSLRRSSEGKEDDPEGARDELESLNLNKNDSVLGIAAGGTTPYVIGALKFVQQLNPAIVTGFLSCSKLEKENVAKHHLVIATGPEVLTGSTRMKAGTATKMALNTISTTLMVRSGRVYQNLMVDLRATNDKLRDRAMRIISTLTDLNREESLELLTRAGLSVKTALVMQHLSSGREEAEARLSEVDGRIHEILPG